MTQGIVTVVKDGKVIIKIITGSDGKKAAKLAKRIEKDSTLKSAKDLYALAIKIGFGGEDSLVVLTETKTFHKTGERINRRYRQTFNQPEFNPRWKEGTAEHVKVVNL